MPEDCSVPDRITVLSRVVWLSVGSFSGREGAILFSVLVTQCVQHGMKGQEGTVIGTERRWRYGRSCPGICRERLMKTTEYVRFGLSCSQNSSGHYMYCQF